MSKRTLIIGGSGLLGLNWAIRRSSTDHVILGVHKRKVKLNDCEIAEVYPLDFDELYVKVQILKPDLIINSAAMTSVDECEMDYEKSKSVNADLACNVARVAYSLNIKLVHISTDHLTNGLEAMKDETAECKPVNNYGKTKHLGELAVLKECPDALCVRVNFFCWGPYYRKSFSDWILESAQSKTRITMFKNVFFTPIYSGKLIDGCHELVETEYSGIFNISSSERVSKFEFGRRLLNQFGLSEDILIAGEYERKSEVQRPLDMSLDNSKFSNLFPNIDLSIDESIEALKEDFSYRSALEKLIILS